MTDPDIRAEEVCPVCDGKRHAGGKACSACGGTGKKQISISMVNLVERVAKLLGKQRGS